MIVSVFRISAHLQGSFFCDTCGSSLAELDKECSLTHICILMNRIREERSGPYNFDMTLKIVHDLKKKIRCILCHSCIYVKRPHKPAEKLFLLHVVRFVDNSAE